MKIKLNKKVIILFLANVCAVSAILPACKNEKEPHIHSYGEWVVVDQPTCTEDGTKERECLCGEKVTESVVATGHSFVEGICSNCNEDDPNYEQSEITTFQVTFNLNYEGAIDIVEQAEYDQMIFAPEEYAIHPDGLTLLGWKTSVDELSDFIEFPYMITEEITFYAIWASAQSYIVKFDANYDGAEQSQTVEVEAGQRISYSRVPNVERVGYDFVGWATTPNATESNVFIPYTPTSNVTLYAVWQQRANRLVLRYNYVDAPSNNFITEEVLHGTMVQISELPIRQGHTFDGWWTEAVGGEKVDLTTTPITNNLILYAHWKADALQTDTFHAEFVEIDHSKIYLYYTSGLSGMVENVGTTVGAGIVRDEYADGFEGVLHDENDYQTNSKHTDSHGHYVSCLYNEGAKLTFKIYSSAAVQNVTLKASLAAEVAPSLTIGPTGDNAYKFIVNGEELSYNPITFNNELGYSSYVGSFSEYVISTTVSLKEGENIIELVTSNSNGDIIGYEEGGIAPMVDYIKLQNYNEATLTWYPVYDNLWNL